MKDARVDYHTSRAYLGSRIDNRSVWEANVATITVEAKSPPVSTTWMDSIRVWLYQSLFTNLCGMTFQDWCKTLQDNQFAIPPKYWHRAALLTAGSALNSWYRFREDRQFGQAIDQTQVMPPLFVLGHWRSGTTLLHNLLAINDRYAFPNLYEVFFPHTFLCTEDSRTGMLAPLIPRTRVFDNVAMGLDMPNEDEFATATATLQSTYMAWAFPKGAARYEPYLTFRGVPDAEIDAWKAALLRFLKKMTIRYQRPLLLKSPPHTGRIKILLEMFPEAKFVHVHRDPFTVFRSTRHLNEKLTQSLQFQKSDQGDADETVIRRYRHIHDAYFDERSLIPDGHLHEIAFSDLERDPVGQLRETYDALDLGGFEDVRPGLEDHVAGLADYRKNTYAELPKALKDRLRHEWRRSFEAWNYPTY